MLITGIDFDHIGVQEAHAVSHLAEAMWAIATSDKHNVADGRGTVYVLTETALLHAIWHIYGLTDDQCRHVRDLLSEYGPDDQLTGTSRRGIESYIEFAKLNPRKHSY